mmetsp:Transcript_9509/g.41615  ORF Transcript_9509/g.41615 Transcript_9509/m.41615 type:complete len:458 (-) Transcript_9509:750-2123(-)
MRHVSASFLTWCGTLLLISKTFPSTKGTSTSPLPLTSITNCTSRSSPVSGTTSGTWMRCPFSTHPPRSVCFNILLRGFMHANCSRITWRMGCSSPKYPRSRSSRMGASSGSYFSNQGNLNTSFPAWSEKMRIVLSTPGLNLSMFDLRPPSDALSSCDVFAQKSGVLCNSARNARMSTSVCWMSRSASSFDVEIFFWRRSIQGTPEGARSRLGARPRGSRTPFASTAKESAVRPAPAAAFGKSCVRMSSTPHESTGLYVECSARCGAATMFSKPRVSTVVRHRNSRPRRSNAPTSAVLDASSRLCRVPNSAMPKYATPSTTVRPFMNVRSLSVQSTSNVPPRASDPTAGSGGVNRHNCPSPEFRIRKPPSHGTRPCALFPTRPISRTRSPVSRSSSTSFDGPRLCSSAHTRCGFVTSPAGASELTCSLTVTVAERLVFVIAGNAYSTTPPPPVFAMNT